MGHWSPHLMVTTMSASSASSRVSSWGRRSVRSTPSSWHCSDDFWVDLLRGCGAGGGRLLGLLSPAESEELSRAPRRTHRAGTPHLLSLSNLGATVRERTRAASASRRGRCAKHSNTHWPSEGGRRWPIKSVNEPLLPIAGRHGRHQHVLGYGQDKAEKSISGPRVVPANCGMGALGVPAGRVASAA